VLAKRTPEGMVVSLGGVSEREAQAIADALSRRPA
jgi:hypothetical protein